MGVREQLQEFQDILDNRYQVIRENNKPGQKVIGWMCSYVPEEIIHAAGLYPVRVWGGKTTSLADAYMHINMCSLVRSTYDEALQGNYDFLDGFVSLNTCDNIRRLYDIWAYYKKTPYYHILPLPHKINQASIEYFRDELERFKESLERGFGAKVTPTALWRAIDLYNHSRSLLRQIDTLRKQPNPPLTGAQFLAVVLAGTILPREKYNARLEKLLAALPQEKVNRDGAVRLLLVGSELDDPEFVRLIEDTGGLVVADDLCTGTKSFWNQVEKNGDAFYALAHRYLNRPDCPRMRPSDRRMEHIKELIKDYNAQGVILEIIQFCKLHQEGSLPVRQTLKELGVPVLALTREYQLTGAGATKTRVEAFLDTIRGI